MKHDFSAHFLRILPPDTNFGESWESLCFDLLDAEFDDHSLIRLSPPDFGIDILHRAAVTAYQCKSSEQGAQGSIPADESIKSLKRACEARDTLKWKDYCLATNANYTGAALKKILEEAANLGVADSQVVFRGPEYWDELCSQHFLKVRHRFDYRISVTEKQVVDAFKKARYFDKYVREYESKIASSGFSIVITSNRTPVEIEIPFSPELSVKNCLDITQELLGISLEWTNFADLGTSAGPSLSLTIDRRAQEFPQKIKDLPLGPGDDLQLWIKIKWKDKREEKGRDGAMLYQMMDLLTYRELEREQLSYAERRQHTLDRAEELIQAMIWEGARRLKQQESASYSA